jgi:copper resistance protein D
LYFSYVDDKIGHRAAQTVRRDTVDAAELVLSFQNPHNAMSIWYYANVTVHVLAAMLWLGGMFFLGIVGAPVFRAVNPPELRQALFHKLGLRFRTIGWWAIATLLLTGVINLHFRGWLHWSGVLGSAVFWRSVTGHALMVKLVAVAVMLVVGAVHDFAIGPRAGQASADSPRAVQLRRRAALLARVNALVGLVVVIAAVRLARG